MHTLTRYTIVLFENAERATLKSEEANEKLNLAAENIPSEDIAEYFEATEKIRARYEAIRLKKQQADERRELREDQVAQSV